jgi:hypothetical protein
MTLSDELREAMERTRKEGMALGDGASTESPVAQIKAWVPAGVRLDPGRGSAKWSGRLDLNQILEKSFPK